MAGVTLEAHLANSLLREFRNDFDSTITSGGNSLPLEFFGGGVRVARFRWVALDPIFVGFRLGERWLLFLAVSRVFFLRTVMDNPLGLLGDANSGGTFGGTLRLALGIDAGQRISEALISTGIAGRGHVWLCC